MAKRRRGTSPKLLLVLAGLGCGTFLFIGAGVGGGIYWYYHARSDDVAERDRKDGKEKADPKQGDGKAASAAKAAELDKQDPGWRFEAVVAKWQDAKIEKNGADLVMEVDAALPMAWNESIKAVLSNDSLVKTANPFLERHVRDVLRQHNNTIAKARQIAYYPDGRFTLQIQKNPLNTQVRGQNAHKVRLFLQALVIRDILEGETDAALLDVWAMVNIGRYQGAEPFSISHLVRDSIDIGAMCALEDVFRHQTRKEASENWLSALQAVLLTEGADPGMHYTARCERATINAVFERLRSKEISLLDVTEGKHLPADQQKFMWDKIEQSHRYFLDKATEAVEITKGPHHEQQKRLDDWGLSINKEEGAIGALLLPALPKLHKSHFYRCAKLRTAAVGLAVERYRRANNDFPADLGKLVPKYIPSVPLDPYTGGALRYRRYAEGVAIYCAAHRGGGEWAGNFADLENRHLESNAAFRLWHPPQRRALPAS